MKVSAGLTAPEWFAGLDFPPLLAWLGPDLNWVAAGFGEVQVASQLGERLYARVPLVGEGAADVTPECVRLIPDSVLQDAHAILLRDGLDAGVARVCTASLAPSHGRGWLSHADRIALLGHMALPSAPRTAFLLAQRATNLDTGSCAAWLLAGLAQEKLGFRDGARSAPMA